MVFYSFQSFLCPHLTDENMKYVIAILLLLLVQYKSKAQTFDEWFKQKKTQKKYLLQQIAALQVYSGYLQKGYEIAEQGLTVIGNIKKGDFNLHSSFIGSLKSINQRISKYTKVTDMIGLQTNIALIGQDTYKQAKSSGLFNLQELHYILEVVTNLYTDCTGLIDEVNTITTASELQM